MSTFVVKLKRTWWEDGYTSGGVTSWIFKVEQTNTIKITTEGDARCCVSTEAVDTYPSMGLKKYQNPSIVLSNVSPTSPLNYTVEMNNDLHIVDAYSPGTNQHSPILTGYDTYEEFTEFLYKNQKRGQTVESKTTQESSHSVGGMWYEGSVLLNLPSRYDISPNSEFIVGGKQLDFELSGIADLVFNDYVEVLECDIPVMSYLSNGEEEYLYTGIANPDKSIDTSSVNKKSETDDDGDSSKTDEDDSDDNPSQTVLNCGGAMNNYVLTTNEIRGIFRWFWNGMIEDARSDNLLEYLTGVFGDMGQCLTSVRMYPVQVPAGAGSNVVLGRYDSGISFPTVSNGTNLVYETPNYTVPRLTKKFLDYAPYNQLLIYLPYIGIQPLDTNMYVGQTIKVKYFVDFTNGGLDVLLFRNGINTEHFNGVIGADVPYSRDGGKGLKDIMIDSLYQSSISTVGSVVGGALGGVGGAVVGNFTNEFLSNATSGGTQHVDNVHHTSTASNNNIFNMPRTIRLWQIKPKYYEDSSYGATNGYVYKKSKKLSGVNGFTICENVKLKFGHTKNSDDVVINPSDDEQMILKQLLESGVYL